MTCSRAALIAVCTLCPSMALAQAAPVAPATRSAPTTSEAPLAFEPPAPPVRSMSLPEALAYAREHQPAVRAALARIRAQTEQANVPRAQWYPTLGLTAQLFAATANNTTGTYVSSSHVDIPRIGATRGTATGTWSPYASTFVGLGANQELFDFGRIAAQAAAADALTDVERQRARSATLDVTFDVEEAYFSVFAAKAILNASEEAYERSRVHRELANAGVGAGLRSPIELTRANADLAQFDIARVRARGGLSTAETVFAAAVGVPDAELGVADSTPSPAELPDLAAAIRRAEASDPRLLEALEQLRADELNTNAIAAETRPNLTLTGTISSRAGGAPASGTGTTPDNGGWLPSVPNWDVGLVLSWPLFDATVSARANASRARAQVRNEELSLVREQGTTLIREAYSAVNVARTVVPGLRRAVDAARANYDQADARFKAGLGTSVELADAENLRTQAEIQLVLGEFELARARASFGRTIAEGT